LREGGLGPGPGREGSRQSPKAVLTRSLELGVFQKLHNNPKRTSFDIPTCWYLPSFKNYVQRLILLLERLLQLPVEQSDMTDRPPAGAKPPFQHEFCRFGTSPRPHMSELSETLSVPIECCSVPTRAAENTRVGAKTPALRRLHSP
jgi:hypothetical protein